MAKSIFGSNGLNARLFSAIKICDKAKQPLLILSNPGMAKSTTVQMYADITGRELIQLRSNSTTHEEIIGYPTVPAGIKAGDTPATVHCRPIWYQKLLDAEAAGKECILFLDELTTASARVQSALLHLIFERKCNDEKIPDSTLIISAGNYMSNLSRDLSGLMPPTMNRFVIYNLQYEKGDLSAFLCHHSGAMMGKMIDFDVELRKLLESIDAQEVDIPEERKNRIYELIENGIADETSLLVDRGSANAININETELESIYEDTEDTDGKVYGFVTPRTLYYASRIAFSAYQCFGKAGLGSEVFRSLLDGLIGVGLRRNKKNGQIEKVKVGGEYFTFLQAVANDIEKLKNNKLPEYEKFFVDILKDEKSKDKEKKVFSSPDMQVIINKISEMTRDPEISMIERPLAPDLITNLCNILVNTSSVLLKDIKSTADLSAEDLANLVVTWNTIVDFQLGLYKLVSKEGLGYSEDVIVGLQDTSNNIKKFGYKLRALRKVALRNDSTFTGLIPETKSLNLKDIEDNVEEIKK